VPCPECGEPTQAGEGEESVCDDCYVERLDVLDVPEEVVVEVCSRCGSYVRDGDWVSHDEHVPDEDVAVRAVKEATRVHVEAREPSLVLGIAGQDPNKLEVHVEVVAVARGRGVEEDEVVTVTLDRASCPTCSKRAGGYYESVVQVRAEGREPTEEETERALEHAYDVAGKDYSDRDTFVTRTEEVRGGLDIYMSTNTAGTQVARRLTDEYGGSYDDSPTLVGERDGEELYRVTYSVFLPEFVAGDIVSVGGDSVVLVTSNTSGEAVKGVELRTGDRTTVDVGEKDVSGELRRLGSYDDAEEATVVTSGDDEVQLLHPMTYETVTVRRPSFLDAPQGAEVEVVATEEGVFPVPASNKKP